MMVQTSRCDDTRTAKHWVENGNPVLPVCSWTVFHLGSSPAESLGRGSARAAGRACRAQTQRGSCSPLTRCDGGEGWVSLSV